MAPDAMKRLARPPALSLDAKSHFAAHIADPVRLSFARRALFPSFVRLSTSTSRQFCQKPARVTGRMCKPVCVLAGPCGSGL